MESWGPLPRLAWAHEKLGDPEPPAEGTGITNGYPVQQDQQASVLTSPNAQPRPQPNMSINDRGEAAIHTTRPTNKRKRPSTENPEITDFEHPFAPETANGNGSVPVHIVFLARL